VGVQRVEISPLFEANEIHQVASEEQGGGMIPCIAITGRDDVFPATRTHGFDAYYMQKPINLAKLSTVAVALAQR
jgi:hypothetical protein